MYLLENLLMTYMPKNGCWLRNEEPTQILTSNDSSDLIVLLKAIVAEYFFNVNVASRHLIFKKKYGLECPQLNLADIGREFKITRERVRQIIFVADRHIEQLLSGKSISKPRIICYKSAYLFNAFKKNLATNKIFALEKVFEILKKYTKEPIEDNYLILIMSLCGYNFSDYQDKNFFYKGISYLTLTRKISLLKTFLSKNPNYNSADILKKELKIDNLLLDFCLSFYPEVETKCDNKTTFYRAPLKNLFSSKTIIYRLLSEIGKPIHKNDLKSILLKQGIDIDLKVTPKRKASDVYDVTSIGKSGFWALRDWDLNTCSISELIMKHLDQKKTPLTFEQIFNAINLQRSIKKNTVNSTLRIYDNLFVIYTDKTFGLKKWRLKKPIVCKSTTRVRRRSIKKEIVNKAIKLFKTNTMSLRDLVKELRRLDYETPSIYSALSKAPELKITKIKGRKTKSVELRMNTSECSST